LPEQGTQGGMPLNVTVKKNVGQYLSPWYSSW